MRLSICFRDGAVYCPRFASDDERAPQWRGAYASSAPPGFAMLRDSRPMYEVGLLANTDMGKALIAEHGDIVSAVAVIARLADPATRQAALTELGAV